MTRGRARGFGWRAGLASGAAIMASPFGRVPSAHPPQCFTVTKNVKHPDPFDRGLIVGLVIGEGSFTGDGKQAQLAISMNVRHERLLEYLRDAVPARATESVEQRRRRQREVHGQVLDRDERRAAGVHREAPLP